MRFRDRNDDKFRWQTTITTYSGVGSILWIEGLGKQPENHSELEEFGKQIGLNYTFIEEYLASGVDC